ncbi:N-acetyltransferase [Cupriavidus basilensis]|uniref:N-acetyltransferase n=1 Tax=Cupriavidus basilensis TaxID=68895 RepID=A0ABT6AZM5_9BURK|nr:N-acetyltransferase [Cupriavidus basilensis]MDF3838072.1 N-acetyltransferase [Cupriavidus basilensis]
MSSVPSVALKRQAGMVFRQAAPRDAAALAPLVLASGQLEFAYLLGGTAHEREAFLRRAIAADSGRFSWRRHRVAAIEDQPIAVLAIQDGRANLLDDPRIALDFLRFFGVRRSGGIVGRGLVLEREIPAPKRRQTLLAHCATRGDMRGRGVFQALFADTMRAGLLPAAPGQALLLDVLRSNTRAAALYRKLGFVTLDARLDRTPRLPAQLRSARMRFQPAPGGTR